MAHCRERWTQSISEEMGDEQQRIITHVGSFDEDEEYGNLTEEQHSSINRGHHQFVHEYEMPLQGNGDEDYHLEEDEDDETFTDHGEAAHPQPHAVLTKLALIEQAQESLEHLKSEISSAYMHESAQILEHFHQEVAASQNNTLNNNINDNTRVAGLSERFHELQEDEEFMSFLNFLEHVKEEQMTEEDLLNMSDGIFEKAQLDFLQDDEELRYQEENDEEESAEEHLSPYAAASPRGFASPASSSSRPLAHMPLVHEDEDASDCEPVLSTIHVQRNNTINSPFVTDVSSEEEGDDLEPVTESSMDALASTFVSQDDEEDEEEVDESMITEESKTDQESSTRPSLPKVIVSSKKDRKINSDESVSPVTARFSLSPVTCSLVLLAAYSLWTTKHRGNLFFFLEVSFIVLLVLLGVSGGSGAKCVRMYSPKPVVSSIFAMLVLTALGSYLSLQTQSLFALDITTGLMLVAVGLLSMNKSFSSALLITVYGIKLLVSLCWKHGKELEQLQAVWAAPTAFESKPSGQNAIPMIYGLATLAWGIIVLTPHLIGLSGELKSSSSSAAKRIILSLGTLLCINGMLLQVRLTHQEQLSNNDLWLVSLDESRTKFSSDISSLLDLGELAFWIGIWSLCVLGRSLSYRKTLMAGVSIFFFLSYSNRLRHGGPINVPQSTCPQKLAVFEAAAKTAFFRYEDVNFDNRLGIIQKCMQPPSSSVAEAVRRRRFRWFGRRNRSTTASSSRADLPSATQWHF